MKSHAVGPPNLENVSAFMFCFIEFFFPNEDMVILYIKSFLNLLTSLKNHIIERIAKKRVENICSAKKIERLMKTQSEHCKRKFGIKSFLGES